MSQRKMKTLILAAVLSALLINTNCQNMLGNYNQIRVPAQQSDPNSCQMYLYADVDYTSNLTNAYTNISQSFIPDPSKPSHDMPAGCAFVNFSFTSFFHDDISSIMNQYTEPVHYNYDSNGNLASSFVNNTIMASSLAAMNGTECMYLRENQNGYDQYLCSINYAGLPLYWVAYGSGSGSNFTFASFSGGPSKWVMAYNHVVQPDQFGAIVNLNTSFPNVVADIYSSCGSGNKHFYSLQTLITVTTSVDLASLIPDEFNSNIAQAYVIVKKYSVGAAYPGNYLVVEAPMSAIQSGSLCWTLGVTWDKVLPDMNYCAGGCMVTIVFANMQDKIYVLKTTGIQTTSNLRR